MVDHFTTAVVKTSLILKSFLSLWINLLFQIIAEGANGPTTIEADKIFIDRNILVIPVCIL